MKTIRIHKPAAVGTTLARLAAVSAALALSGCATTGNIDLPDVTAKEVYVSHQNPLFNVNLHADNLVDHGDHVTADRITYERGGRITSTTIRVEGYRRDKHQAAAPATAPKEAPMSSP